MAVDGSRDSRLDLAARRLERAVTMLEQRLSRRLAEAGAEAGGLFDLDRAQLAQALDASRARERDLAAAGVEASAALARAVVEVKAAMSEKGGEAHGAGDD